MCGTGACHFRSRRVASPGSRLTPLAYPLSLRAHKGAHGYTPPPSSPHPFSHPRLSIRLHLPSLGCAPPHWHTISAHARVPVTVRSYCSLPWFHRRSVLDPPLAAPCVRFSRAKGGRHAWGELSYITQMEEGASAGCVIGEDIYYSLTNVKKLQ